MERFINNALVTGASRGIGAACARALAGNGWHVAVGCRASLDRAEALAEELGGVAVQADVADMEQVQGMVELCGSPELLVCCAGIAHYGLFTDMNEGQWRRLFAVNVDGARNCISAVAPEMIRRKRGCIILLSSVWGVHGASCEAAYSATKAAIIGLTRALAKELGPSGIRVNCVAPGVISTDMLGGFSEGELAALADDTPLCRLGTTEDVARAVAFLASDSASFITGQVLGVDGGFAI